MLARGGHDGHRSRTLDFLIVSHPSLGLPPRDLSAGLPDAAARIRAAAPRLAARALEVAIDGDPSMRERNDDTDLRARLHDAELLAERIALAVASDDTTTTAEYADWTSPVYRRKRVPLDDLIHLLEGLRVAMPSVLGPHEQPYANRAIDAAIAQYRWHRRIAGDARRKNPLAQFLYKGA